MRAYGKSLMAKFRLQMTVNKKLDAGKECRVYHIGPRKNCLVRHYIDPVSKLAVAEEILLQINGEGG